MIRELREEVEKLRQMMMGGNSSGEMDALREKLSISESLMAEMTKSWEERLRETERLHHVSILNLSKKFLMSNYSIYYTYIYKYMHTVFVYL